MILNVSSFYSHQGRRARVSRARSMERLGFGVVLDGALICAGSWRESLLSSNVKLQIKRKQQMLLCSCCIYCIYAFRCDSSGEGDHSRKPVPKSLFTKDIGVPPPSNRHRTQLLPHPRATAPLYFPAPAEVGLEPNSPSKHRVGEELA